MARTRRWNGRRSRSLLLSRVGRDHNLVDNIRREDQIGRGGDGGGGWPEWDSVGVQTMDEIPLNVVAADLKVHRDLRTDARQQSEPPVSP